MKIDVPFRIVVKNPLPGVTMCVQRGRSELLPPSSASNGAMTFDLSVSVDLSGEVPNFLGKYSQGPKSDRFIYVNSGTYAGQKNTAWARRAKLSLMNITKEQIDEAISSPNARIETTFNGTGKDGGPTCASVKGIVWKVVQK
jgi:hypothetical protein